MYKNETERERDFFILFWHITQGIFLQLSALNHSLYIKWFYYFYNYFS